MVQRGCGSDMENDYVQGSLNTKLIKALNRLVVWGKSGKNLSALMAYVLD
jgi:hypothetical protein